MDSGEDKHAHTSFNLRMAKAMADPWRIRILLELNMRDMSATQFYEQFGGGSVTRIYRHFKVLEEYGWLVKVGEKSGGQRRGATEHFYRAIKRVMFDNESWSKLPASIKSGVTRQAFETFAERVRDATEAGTIDARDNSHFGWTPASLDQRGWDNVMAKVDAVLDFLLEEQENANQRMAQTGEQPIPMTVALMAFESPPGSIRTESSEDGTSRKD